MQDTENTEIFVPEVDTSIVLTPTSDQPASVADVVAQAAGALSLDNETATAIVAMLDRMGAASVTTEDVEFLAKAFSCDEDLKNADAAGYLRGRNENIEATHNFPNSDGQTSEATFPRYARRSIWD